MKNGLAYITALLTGMFFFTSCNEEVNLIGGFEETAVIYGLLDQSDSLHYIKINRAFIGPGNSLDIAQIPDSNYFDQVDAKIEEFVSGTKTREWSLRDTLIDNKETNGVFYAPQEKLYYFATRKCKANGDQQLNTSNPADLLNSLNENASYTLTVSVNNGQFEVTGTTDLVKNISCPTIEPVNYRFDFINNDGSYGQSLLKVNSGSSSIMNTSMEVKFLEMEKGVDTSLVTFKWNLGESEVDPNGFKMFTVGGQTFYELIRDNCSTDPSINRRRFTSIKIIMTGGSEALLNYITVNKPSSSLAQNKPTFTNLNVTNGFKVAGLFSSRYTYSVEKLYLNPFNNSLRMLTVESVEELCLGPITGEFFFCSQHPADNGEAFYCN
jgi:hypothetical protein